LKKVAILQSSYIPWKGYFDIINSVDEFVVYDEVQYTVRDWRNRNYIKTREGVKWLTIPVKVKGLRSQRISETRVADSTWAERHWRSICYSYSGAGYFSKYSHTLEEAYRESTQKVFLSEINILFISTLCEILGIGTKITQSSEYGDAGDRNSRLVDICRAAEASIYLTGPSAAEYLDTGLFQKHGIDIEWADYSGYSEYRQLHPPFVHNVSAIDLILNEGENAASYLKGSL
jgi:hypothetical protein